MARPAKLYNCGGDVFKKWFVYFSYRNPETGKLERIKVSDGFGQYKTAEEKTTYAQKLIASINLKLKNGWNPFAKEHMLYRLVEDEAIYNSTLLTFHLQTALDGCKPDLRKKSYQSYQSYLNGFKVWLESEKLSIISIQEFNKGQARQLVDYLIIVRKLARKTRNAYLITMKMLFQKVVDEDIIITNPFVKIKRVSHSSVPVRHFDDYQKQVLKEHISINNPQLWLLIEFMFFCFLRPNELRRIKTRDIHGGKILVKGEIAKNKKTEYVLIPKPLLKTI